MNYFHEQLVSFVVAVVLVGFSFNTKHSFHLFIFFVVVGCFLIFELLNSKNVEIQFYSKCEENFICYWVLFGMFFEICEKIR